MKAFNQLMSPSPFMYIQHMPHSQVQLSHSVCSSGARLGEASTHGEHPLAILFHNHRSQASGVKSGDQTDFHAGPRLNMTQELKAPPTTLSHPINARMKDQ